jgi:hypothetical protein
MEGADEAAAELVVLFEDSVLDVRYLRPGARFRAGADPSADLAWPDPCELLRVGEGGRIEPCTPPSSSPFRVEPLRSTDARDYFGDDEGAAAPRFLITLGALRVLARPAQLPQQRPLRPRFDWASNLGVALIPLLFTFVAVGVRVVPPTTRSLVIDPSLVRSVHVELEGRPRAAEHRRMAPARQVLPPKPKLAGINPFAADQTWAGTYFCAQGETRLFLRVHDVTDGTIYASFDFVFEPGNVVGLFAVNGHYSRATGRVRFDPGDWIARPSGYVTVGLDGTASAMRYEGEVFGPGCGHFSLTRAP